MCSPHRSTNWYRVMVINKKINIYLTPFLGWGLVLLCGFSCGPTELPRLNLEFEIPVSTIPAKEIYFVGDTLSIKILFSKELKDMTSEYSYSFENFDFRGAVRVVELVDKTKDQASQPGAFGSIELKNEIGGFEIVSDSGAELNFHYDRESYILMTKLILKKQGIYSIIFFTRNSSLGVTSLNRTLEIPGYIANIKNIYYKVNEGIVTNNHLINENTINYFDENDVANNWYKPFFSFKVVEK